MATKNTKTKGSAVTKKKAAAAKKSVTTKKKAAAAKKSVTTKKKAAAAKKSVTTKKKAAAAKKSVAAKKKIAAAKKSVAARKKVAKIKKTTSLPAAAKIKPAPVSVYPLLTDYFDKVYVINSRNRPDRREDTKEALKGLADLDKIIFYDAVWGSYTTYPAGWNGGEGAWGCLQSHRRIMEDVMHDRNVDGDLAWESILILEDDIYFLDNFLENMNTFMSEVPADWGQIYLGGQHRKAPTPTASPHVFIGNQINRTHAIAMSSQYINQIYRHVSYLKDYMDKDNHHMDHQLEIAHGRRDWPVYAPAYWLGGQRAGLSDINCKDHPAMTWQW